MSVNGKQFTPTISGLRNDGVAVKVWRTESYTEIDPDSKESVTLWRALPEKRDLTIRFTNRVMSDLEIEFGSMDEWQKTLSIRPYNVVLGTLVIVTGKSRDQVSEMLDSSTNEEYQVALLITWMMAMGADQKELGKMLGSASKLGRAKDSLITGILSMADKTDELLAETFPGQTFLPDGSEVVEASSPSGDIPLPKLSLSSEPTGTAKKAKVQ